MIYWRDQPVDCSPGETIAYALLQAGLLDQGFGKSCTGQVYGLFCGIGACQGCLVEVDGRGVVEACMTMAEENIRVYPLGEERDNDRRLERLRR